MKCAVCIMTSDTVEPAMTIVNGTAVCRMHMPKASSWESTSGGPLSYQSFIRNAYPGIKL